MIHAAPCQPDDVRAVLMTALTPKTDRAGQIDIDSVLAGAVCIKMEDDAGRIVGAYVLHAEGPVLWVRAAAGRASIDLTQVMAALLERQGREFDEIGFQTQRPGLIKKAQALGYRVTGENNGFTQMRKYLR
jgi:hypothetical protein